MRLLLSRLIVAVAAAVAAGLLTLAECARNVSDRGPSPEDMGLKPDSTDPFRFPDLVELPGRQYDPRQRDLNTTALLARLGKNFDPAFMSVHRPRNHTQAIRFPFRHHKGGKHGGGRLVPVAGAEMPAFLRRMNLKSLKLPDNTRLRTHVSPRLQKKLLHFLWAWTACPVTHEWRDLGQRYWPRYVLEGKCPTGRVSCSVPPGMTCAPSQKVLKVILRWQCSPPAGAATASLDGGGGGAGHGHMQCQWMEINNYPIVTACACGCPPKGS